MAYYFKHDDNARRDAKMVKLRRIKGMKGIGIYWCLIEIMHEEEGEILSEEINSIAYELQEDENNIKDILNNFGLFVILPYGFGNTRVSESLQERYKKSKTAKANVKKRWDKEVLNKQEVNTTVLPNQYNGNTIREDKRIEYKHLINFCDELMSNSDWVFSIYQKYKIESKNIPTCLNKFIAHLISTLDTNKTKQDFATHFSNWLKTNKPAGSVMSNI